MSTLFGKALRCHTEMFLSTGIVPGSIADLDTIHEQNKPGAEDFNVPAFPQFAPSESEIKRTEFPQWIPPPMFLDPDGLTQSI